MSFQTLVTNRFVKSEDLNHHGTLFAGRSAEWFIEAGLMAVSGILPADNIVCVKLNEISRASRPRPFMPASPASSRIMRCMWGRKN